MKPLVLVLTGGAGYFDRQHIFDTLDELVLELMDEGLRIDVVILGDAEGADALFRIWCEGRNIKHRVFKADWVKYKAWAGPRRNDEMAECAASYDKHEKLCIGFPGLHGTADAVMRARLHMIHVRPCCAKHPLRKETLDAEKE